MPAIATAPAVQTATKTESRHRRARLMHGRLHRQRERAAARALRSFLSTLSSDVLRNFKAIGIVAPAIDELIEPSLYRVDFARAMRPQWSRAIWAGVELERSWIETGEIGQQSVAIFQEAGDTTLEPDDAHLPPSIKVDPSESQLLQVKEFLESRTSGVWSRVGKTTRKFIERTIRKGIADGLTYDEMQERLRSRMKSYTDYQARRIARTETTGAIGFGGQSERADAGITHKEWVARIDSRTRTFATGPFDHLEASGQVVPNDQAFDVSGEALMYPGDSNGSAGNIIQCRCSALASLGD